MNDKQAAPNPRAAFFYALLKCRAESMLIGRKYRHHISSAITPLLEVEPSLLAKIPVIGIIRQLKKNTP